jgi:large subunit ribosomal protein L3
MSEETNAVAENAAPENTESHEKSLNLKSFIGQKAGMTRIFDKDGKDVPVSVIKLIPNVVTQIKSEDKDGYNAYQVGYYEKREKLVSSPKKGHLKKANTDKNLTRFFEVKLNDVDSTNLGKEVAFGEFEAEQFVDVTGISKGKGFQGVMKRYGFRGGPATHGSHFHRTGGSIGNRATPGKVFKLKKMPGHMGAKKQTVQNLKIVELNLDKGYMLIKGSIPGHKNAFVKVSRAIKK